MIKVCINCSNTFETSISKKVACTRKCSQNYRHREVYKDKYTAANASLSPRNFLRTLSKKKSNRRDLDVDFLVELYEKQGGLCALSGKTMTYQKGRGRIPTNISIDRINPSTGYEKDNIQLVCIQANKMKAELLNEELYGWCQDILDNHKKK